MAKEDYYEVLGVERTVTVEDHHGRTSERRRRGGEGSRVAVRHGVDQSENRARVEPRLSRACRVPQCRVPAVIAGHLCDAAVVNGQDQIA